MESPKHTCTQCDTEFDLWEMSGIDAEDLHENVTTRREKVHAVCPNCGHNEVVECEWPQ